MNAVMRDMLGIVPWVTSCKELISHLQFAIRGGCAYVVHMLSLCEDLLETGQIQLISEVVRKPEQLKRMNRRPCGPVWAQFVKWLCDPLNLFVMWGIDNDKKYIYQTLGLMLITHPDE